MPKTRKSHPPSLTAKVAVPTIRAHQTAAQIAQMFDVIQPTWAAGKEKRLRACRMSLATALSRCANRPIRERTNCTNRSVR